MEGVRPLPFSLMGETHTAAAIDDPIEIAVPLRPEHASTLRVLVASLGSDNGLSIDEIDDVKLAVSEVFTLLLDDAEGIGARRAHVSFSASDGTLDIALHRGIDGDRLTLDPLAETILSSVVDRYEISDHGIALIKHASETVD